MGMGHAPPKNYGGGWLYYHPPIRMGSRLDCSMRSFKKTTRHVCIFYFFLVKYQFYIHFQNKYQLVGSPTRPLNGFSPLNPSGWLSSPGYLPLCVNPSPQSYRAVDATAQNNMWRHHCRYVVRIHVRLSRISIICVFQQKLDWVNKHTSWHSSDRPGVSL